MFDILEEIAAIHRAVAVDGAVDVVAVSVARTYDADREDVWDALTSPERLRRWFYPVRGDLAAGGSFQLEGNAGGDIQACDRPALLRVTFGGPESVVEVRLDESAEGTSVELVHTVPLALAGSGAGALFVGPGWDGALVALGRHLRGELVGDPLEAANAPEMVELNRGSIRAWTEAVVRSATASDDEIAAAREMAVAQYTTVPEPAAPTDG